jgi:hypothetical protein
VSKPQTDWSAFAEGRLDHVVDVTNHTQRTLVYTPNPLTLISLLLKTHVDLGASWEYASHTGHALPDASIYFASPISFVADFFAKPL